MRRGAMTSGVDVRAQALSGDRKRAGKVPSPPTTGFPPPNEKGSRGRAGRDPPRTNEGPAAPRHVISWPLGASSALACFAARFRPVPLGALCVVLRRNRPRIGNLSASLLTSVLRLSTVSQNSDSAHCSVSRSIGSLLKKPLQRWIATAWPV